MMNGWCCDAVTTGNTVAPPPHGVSGMGMNLITGSEALTEPASGPVPPEVSRLHVAFNQRATAPEKLRSLK